MFPSLNGRTPRALLADRPATTLASAGTVDIGKTNTQRVIITGTTAITSFGARRNALRIVKFSGALTLTHNATSLILLGGASRVTVANAVGIYESDYAGNWRELFYTDQDTSSKGSPTFAAETITGLLDLSGALAGQVKFPSSQNASSNANTLDDYKEFTWTPTFQSLTVVGAPAHAGRGTKIGNRVDYLITVAAATSVASTGGSTYCDNSPVTSNQGQVPNIAMSDDGSKSGIGQGSVAGTNIFLPGIAATTKFYCSGLIFTA